MVLPEITVAVGQARELDLGGRKLELRAYPTAHTNNDLTVLDRATGTLWLSDLLFVQHIPVIDGSILGWLSLMEEIGHAGVTRVVPGHGSVPSDWKQAVARQDDYLRTLAADVRREIRSGGIREAVEKVGLEQRNQWLLFDDYHGRNVTAAFVELEWE